MSTAPIHDPLTPAVVYAGTANGVVRSTDGGASWARTALFGWVESIVIDPITPSTIFASCSGPVSYGGPTQASGSVFKSTDAGASWTLVLDTSGGPNVDTLAIDPVTPSTVYAGGRNGVRKTTDGGATWTTASSGLGSAEVFALAVDPTSPSTLLAGTLVIGDEVPVFKSVDGAASWQPSHAGMMTANFVRSLHHDPVTPATVYANTGGSIWKSVDGGASWMATGPGLPLVTQWLAIDPADPARLYVASNHPDDGGLYVSTDAGASWSPTGCAGFGATGVTVSPVGSTVLVVAAKRFAYPRRGGIYASDDGGATCTLSSQGITTFAVFGFAVDPHTGTLYLGDAETSAYRSTDGGATWTDANTGITGISRLLSNVATDAGTPDTVYVTGGNTLNDRVWKSSDGGATWAVSFGPRPLIHSLATSPTRPGHVFVGVDAFAFDNPPPPFPPIFVPASVQRTTDGGTTWTGLNLPSSFLYVSAIAIDPSAPDVVFLGTDRGVLKSVDGGATFPQLSSGLPSGQKIEAIAVDPSLSSVVYASTAGEAVWSPGSVFKSVDGGASWTLRSTGLPHTGIQSLAVDPAVPAVVYAATYDGGVYRSIDGALSWAPFNDGLSSPYAITLTFDPTRPGRLYVGTLTSSVFVRDVGGCPDATCGDGVAQGCEACDDGALNGSPGSCCASTCQFQPAGTACAADDSLCTTDACDGAGTCTSEATIDPSCARPAAGGGVLKIDDRPSPRADGVTLTIGKGPAVAKADFGTPNAGTTYELCLFDTTTAGTTLAYRGRALPPCSAAGCWQETATGWKFSSRGGADGVVSLSLKAGVAGKSRFQVRAKPAALASGTLPLQDVTAELRSSNGGCWGATFSAPSRNDATRYRAKSG